MESLKDITNILESFVDIYGLRINGKETQAMIFGCDSSTTKPAENTLGSEWVKRIPILGVTLTCDLEGMDYNFYTKYEAIKKMLKHRSQRTLNLWGRISKIKSPSTIHGGTSSNK